MTINNKEYTQWKKTYKRKRAILAICLTTIGVGVGIGIGCAIWFKDKETQNDETGLLFNFTDIPERTNLKGDYLQINEANFPTTNEVLETLPTEFNSAPYILYAEPSYDPEIHDVGGFIGILGDYHQNYVPYAFFISDREDNPSIVGIANGIDGKFQLFGDYEYGDKIQINFDTTGWTWHKQGGEAFYNLFEECLSAQKIFDRES